METGVKQGKKQILKHGVIDSTNNNGGHVTCTGQVVYSVTDEPMENGDRVLFVKDNKGKLFAVGGRK